MATWTDAQQRVIDTRDKNILVSAAAGSGKTAVLVERIIRRILDENNPIDVDKIMVVTFTNAAAGEMRDRILKAIEKELEKNPDNLHLQKQQAYIHNAYITTLHSFCLNLVREHFNDIDLDPGVRVAEPGEIELLKSDVVKEVLEEYYSSGDAAFFRFVMQFEDRTSDDYLEEMILSLYDKAMGYTWPDEWLDDCVKKYEYRDEAEFKNSVYVRLLNRYADGVLMEMVKEYTLMLNICANGGPYVYTDRLNEEKAQIEGILGEKDYDRRRTKLNMEFSRLPACGKNVCEPELKELVANSRKNVKANIEKLKKRIYSQNTREAYVEADKCHDIIKTYVEVTKTFMERFKEKKRTKNLIDFNDFEHYAIEILVARENGECVPTKTADELAGDFEEIMVDEYQDSNLVQETIISALSGERFGKHNRFMVGDVKQSIYGFRGANPDIFVEKYNTYSAAADVTDYKIILDKNFRSRRGIIDTTNFLFYQIMNSELGNIDYDEENRLNYGAVLPEPDEDSEAGIDDRTELILINTKETPPDAKENADETWRTGETEKIKSHSNDTDEGEQQEEEEDVASTAFEAEAKVIAKRIKELTDKDRGMSVYDKNLQVYRKLKYSDIVILLRSVGKNADSISEELMKEGIPVYMESKTGYFGTLEIRTIVSYLKIIDNPTLDIPMAAVLKSPFVGISDKEIAILRAVCGKDRSLFEDIKLYLKMGESGAEGKGEEQLLLQMPPELQYSKSLADKLTRFVGQLNGFRNKVIYMSIYELVTEVLNETDYENFISAMPSGMRRLANIEMLKAKAADYENGSYKGLFNFIRYIEKMDKYNIDLGEASIANENDNTVRIMTIHKSKGLEFPVVFIANINKTFNLMDARKKSTLHSKLGIGIDYIDEDTRLVTKNIIKFAINKQIELDAIEEELRLFYVACTRAKDKLIFTGTGVDKKRLLKMVSQRKNDSRYLGYGVVSQFLSYMDFLTVPLARNKAFGDIYSNELDMEPPTDNALYDNDSNVSVRYVGMSDIFENLIKEKYLEGMSTEALKNLDTEITYSQEVREAAEQIMSFEYLYKRQTDTHAKMSVSEIKKISYENEQEERSEEDAVRFDFMAEYLKSVEEGVEDTREDIEENAKEGIGENTKEDMRENTEEDMQKNAEEGMQENTKEDMRENAEEDMQKNAEEGMQENTKEDMQENTKESMWESTEEDDENITKIKDEQGVETHRGTRKLSAAKRGTVYHTIFEKFDYNIEPSWNNIASMLDRLEQDGTINKEEKECIRIKDFYTFTKTKLYERMKSAYLRGELYREAQFVVGFSETEIDEFKRIAKMIGEGGKVVEPEMVDKAGDTILIQGIIDAYFIENDKIIIVDYKTDNVKSGDELTIHYYVQLALYKKAVEQITGRAVSEKILYSTRLGEEIAL